MHAIADFLHTLVIGGIIWLAIEAYRSLRRFDSLVRKADSEFERLMRTREKEKGDA